jgi:hypothetical protein
LTCMDSLPFSGLGFDLTTVCVVGSMCVLVWARPGAMVQAAGDLFFPLASSGYALLVKLGREIRGR